MITKYKVREREYIDEERQQLIGEDDTRTTRRILN